MEHEHDLQLPVQLLHPAVHRRPRAMGARFAAVPRRVCRIAGRLGSEALGRRAVPAPELPRRGRRARQRAKARQRRDEPVGTARRAVRVRRPDARTARAGLGVAAPRVRRPGAIPRQGTSARRTPRREPRRDLRRDAREPAAPRTAARALRWCRHRVPRATGEAGPRRDRLRRCRARAAHPARRAQRHRSDRAELLRPAVLGGRALLHRRPPRRRVSLLSVAQAAQRAPRQPARRNVPAAARTRSRAATATATARCLSNEAWSQQRGRDAGSDP